MGSMKREEDEEEEEPVTPAGRLFQRPEFEQVINCAMGFNHPIDEEAIKAEVERSIMIQHPRFRSVLVSDNQGRERWRKTKVDLDKHLVFRDIDGDHDDDDEDIVNEYLADLSLSSSLSRDKPLWEIHVLRRQKCIVLRVHHSLGDGISLMSLFLACCRQVDHPDKLPTIPSSSSSSSSSSYSRTTIWRLLVVVVFTLVFVLKFIGRALGFKDEKTSISGGDGVELWPRKLVTAKLRLDDMKVVKKAVPKATVNDVLFGVISSGLSRYLDLKSTKELREGLQITGLAMVNIRKQPGLQELSNLMQSKSSAKWGNKFGFMVVPVYYHKRAATDPLGYVNKAKVMLDRKKLSLEAHFSYIIGYIIMFLFGPKVAAYLNYRVICNTSFTISNVVGPQEKIMFAGNPINYIRVSSTSLAHAITMHMVSYAGAAEMQILVAKDIIPEPHVLAKCFQEALLEMKDAAESNLTQ